jgi:YegS/Rv2252/BmrU family lipid kinase
MKPRRIMLIVNPTGGIKSGLTILNQIKPIFDAGGIELNIIETRYAGHAKDIARSAVIEDYESIAIVGGDGSMHEVINGLFSRSDNTILPIGLIPAGTGNSLMHDFKCLDPSEATRNIVKGYTRKLDIAKVKMEHKTVYAFNIVGWGLVTDINLRAEGVRWMGESRYTYSALMEIMTIKKRHAKLTLEDKTFDEKFIFILGCLTQHTGSAMRMAPRALLDDGLIDIIIVRETNRKKILNVFPKIYSGDHIKSNLVEYHQVSHYSIIPDRQDPMNIDGETIGSTPIDVTVVPKAYEIYVPKDIFLG